MCRDRSIQNGACVGRVTRVLKERACDRLRTTRGFAKGGVTLMRAVLAVVSCWCLMAMSCRRDVAEPAQSSLDAGMISIAAATLRMGCDSARDSSCSPTEQPPHPVKVQGFRIDRTEVSQVEYAACIRSGRCTQPVSAFNPAQRPRRPVTQVTWAQARAFCRSNGKRLPTEAEWELAARGTDGRIYPWGDERPTCDKAHTHECGEQPADVGGRHAGASPFGVLDMAGNVDEWVEDRYVAYGTPHAPGSPSGERVARGGAYDAWHSRSTARNALQPDYHDTLLGFRCAAPL